MQNINQPLSANDSERSPNDRPYWDRRLQRFTIIAAYSVAVLLAMDFVQSVEVAFGLGL